MESQQPDMLSILTYDAAEKKCQGITQCLVTLDLVLENTLIQIYDAQHSGILATPERVETLRGILSEWRENIKPHMNRQLRHNVPLPPCQCKMPARITAAESEQWKCGTLYGVRFDDDVDENTVHFNLHRRNRRGIWECIVPVYLMKSGLWSCGAFRGIHKEYYPRTIHPDFRRLVKWVQDFYSPGDGLLLTPHGMLMCRKQPE